MFAKGNKKFIKYVLTDETEADFVEETVKTQAVFGIRSIIFVYKEFLVAEEENLIFDLKNARLSPINVDKKVAAVYEKFEKNLKYLGLAGLECVISDENKKTITTLNNAGVKT